MLLGEEPTLSAALLWREETGGAEPLDLALLREVPVVFDDEAQAWHNYDVSGTSGPRVQPKHLRTITQCALQAPGRPLPLLCA